VPSSFRATTCCWPALMTGATMLVSLSGMTLT